MPAYDEIFNDQEIWNLVKFIKEEGDNYRNYYAMSITGSYPRATVRFVDIGKGGDRANGDRLYKRQGAACHGPDGTALDLGGKSAEAFAREKTYEMVHKIRFGQPGSAMSGTPLTVREMNDLHRALAEKTTYPDLQKLRGMTARQGWQEGLSDHFCHPACRGVKAGQDRGQKRWKGPVFFCQMGYMDGVFEPAGNTSHVPGVCAFRRHPVIPGADVFENIADFKPRME